MTRLHPKLSRKTAGEREPPIDGKERWEQRRREDRREAASSSSPQPTATNTWFVTAIQLARKRIGGAQDAAQHAKWPPLTLSTKAGVLLPPSDRRRSPRRGGLGGWRAQAGARWSDAIDVSAFPHQRAPPPPAWAPVLRRRAPVLPRRGPPSASSSASSSAPATCPPSTACAKGRKKQRNGLDADGGDT